jgi:hypothetical protein
MIEAAADWEPAFTEWLKPFLEALGHKVRRRWAPVDIAQRFRGDCADQYAAEQGGECGNALVDEEALYPLLLKPTR